MTSVASDNSAATHDYPTLGPKILERRMRVIDLTREIFEGMPVWFGHQKTFISTNQTHDEFKKVYKTELGFEAHNLLISEHAGTHTDAVFEYDRNLCLRMGEVNCLAVDRADPAIRVSFRERGGGCCLLLE